MAFSTRGPARSTFLLALAWLLPVVPLAATAPAAAHPHVFVTVEATVVYERGAITAIRHRWTFDEMYTAMAIQGLDVNNDGIYDRKELAELAQVNMDGLKDFDYFTFVRLADSPLRLAAPRDAFLEHDKNQGLTLDFVLPLAQPVLAEAKGFAFQVTDPSVFIAFELAKKDPVRLGAGAPQGCAAKVADASSADADTKRLSDAFAGQLGAGLVMSQTISVSCTP